MQIYRALFSALRDWTLIKVEVSAEEEGDWAVGMALLPLCGYLTAFFSYLPFVILGQYYLLSTSACAILALVCSIVITAGTSLRELYNFFFGVLNGKGREKIAWIGVIALLVIKFMALYKMVQELYPWYAVGAAVVARFMPFLFISSLKTFEDNREFLEEIALFKKSYIHFVAYFLVLPCLVLPQSIYLFLGLTALVLWIRTVCLTRGIRHRACIGALIEISETIYLTVGAFIAANPLWYQ